MLPAQTSKPPNTTDAAVFRPRLTHAHREDVPMECRPTALDPEEDDTPQLTFDSHSQLNSHIETEHLNAEETPVFCAIPEEKTTKEHTVDQGALTVHADGANVGDPRLANERTSTVNANAANVGDPRLLAHVCEKIPQFTSYMSAVPEASRRLDEYRLNWGVWRDWLVVSNILYFPSSLGSLFQLSSTFGMDWNHQPGMFVYGIGNWSCKIGMDARQSGTKRADIDGSLEHILKVHLLIFAWFTCS